MRIAGGKIKTANFSPSTRREMAFDRWRVILAWTLGITRAENFSLSRLHSFVRILFYSY
jgi:hypothetical protein